MRHVINSEELQSLLVKGRCDHLLQEPGFQVREEDFATAMRDAKLHHFGLTDEQYEAQAAYRLVARQPAPKPDTGSVVEEITPPPGSSSCPDPRVIVQVVPYPERAMTFERWVIVGLIGIQIMEALHAALAR